MIIDSVRFGRLEIPDDKVITMQRPILGFEHLAQFCLIQREEMAPFHWLHSTKDPSVAFIVLNPAIFFEDYRIEVNPKEIAELEIDDLKSVETYAIVTVPEDPKETSVNLQGPILINTENGFAKQLVLVNSDYRVKHLIADELAFDDVAITPEQELVEI
ncbi:MAG: flagellar assembly protein FliW [candidate division Zixibacteria bacterium]|nr:flagellar assembly protein FliW [candidate division Zixibacteria bacterium]MDH3939180.1 flagellar assembly protein FliW [candidate division Zixibacteria bacterium]